VQKKHLFLLFLTMFLMMLGFGIIIPILPFFVEKAGANSFQIGILSASYNVMQFIFSPLWGALSDRVGRRPLIMLGLFGFAVTFILFGMSTTYNEMLFYRILSGIVSAAAIPTVTAMVADMFPPAERAKGMGVLGAGVGLSFVFGPAIGGLLSTYSLAYPFFASGIVALITLVFVALLLPESLPAEKRKAGYASEKRQNPLVSLFGSLGLMYNILFIVSLAFAGLETTFALYISDLYGMTSKDLGYMFLIMGLIGAFFQAGLVGRLVKKFGEPLILRAGLICYTIGFIAILFSDNFWGFALILTLFGAGQGMIRTTVTAMITQRTRQGQGLTSGTMSSMDSLGRIVGPLLGGALYVYSYSGPYVAGAILIGAILVLFQVRYRYLPKPTEV